jgi:hypothetical protein
MKSFSFFFAYAALQCCYVQLEGLTSRRAYGSFQYRHRRVEVRVCVCTARIAYFCMQNLVQVEENLIHCNII